MKELTMEEMESINGGVNWVELCGGAVQVVGSLVMDTSGVGAVVGAATGIAGLAEMDQAVGYNPF